MLYTVRAECERDFPGTLREIASLGYDGVEIFALHGHDATDVRRMLDDLGLAVAARHVSLDTVETGLPELAAECSALGTNRAVLTWVGSLDSAAEAAEKSERVVQAARSAAEAGLELGFHNHFDELRSFDGDGTFLDRLLADDAVFLELDLGWVWYARADTPALLVRAQGRCPVVHVKDFASREGYPFRPVGEGVVDYERILPLAVAAGVEWLVVEQDETDGPAIEAVGRSLGAVRSILSDLR